MKKLPSSSIVLLGDGLHNQLGSLSFVCSIPTLTYRTLLETSAHWSTSCETSSPRAEMHLPSVSQSCRILTPDIHQTLNAAGLSWDLGA